MDPRSRIVYVVMISVLAVIFEQLHSLALLAMICVIPLLAAPIGWVWRRRALVGIIAIVWGTTLSQALFYGEAPRTLAFELGPLTFWREGIEHGLIQSLRMVAVTAAGLSIAATTPLDRLLAGLIRLRVPFSLAFLAVMSLRFLPEVGREVLVVRRARARRGRPAWRRSPRAWLQLELSLLRPIVARAVRRARSISESLDVRGFDADSPRAVHRPLYFRRGEPVALIVGVITTTGLLVARLLYVAYLNELAYFPSLRPLYGFVRQWL